MHHAACMRVRHCVGELTHETHAVSDGKRSLARQSLAKRFAVDVGHYIVEKSSRLSRIVHAEHVRMRELCRDPDLAEEALGAAGRDGLVEDLDRDVAVVAAVAREINGRHPTMTELALNGVAVGQSDS